MLRRARDRRRIGRDLRQALTDDQLDIVFEPIVDLSTGRIRASEALLHSRVAGGPTSPDTFISLAEEEGTSIGPVGLWVLTNACAELAAIRRWLARTEPLGVSINVAATNLAGHDLIEDVSTALRVSGLAPADLCLEVTATTLLQELPMALKNLAELRSMGVRSALDDCWAGYVSTLFVQHFRVDIVKLQPAFVRNVSNDAAQKEVVRSVIRIAHSLGAQVVASGVENLEQTDTLSELRCDALQGPYFAPPLPPCEFSALCAREQRLWNQEA